MDKDHKREAETFFGAHNTMLTISDRVESSFSRNAKAYVDITIGSMAIWIDLETADQVQSAIWRARRRAEKAIKTESLPKAASVEYDIPF